ncbi:MAG: 30S ribosome-binding factor RbfA [Candidatus Dormibacteria bacterium]
MTTNFRSHAQHSLRPPRGERIAELLRQEISQLMLTEMKDPRVRMASVSSVRMSRDNKSARVMVSASGSDSDRRQVVRALRHADGYLRAQLGQRLESLKTAPQLHFELDESIAYSVHISSVLRQLDGGSPDTGGGDGRGAEAQP